MLAEKQRASVFNKDKSAAYIVPRYGEQAKYLDQLLIMYMTQAYYESEKAQPFMRQYVQRVIRDLLIELGWIEDEKEGD